MLQEMGVTVWAPSPAQEATASLIVLHGLGADGRDFVPIALLAWRFIACVPT